MLGGVKSFAWAVCGGLVIAHLFFVAIGGVNPVTARTASLVVAGLAVLWLTHAWRSLLHGATSSRADRERRGF
jgi:branched-subunit amino acid ABC-type transport system permease component